jgi:tetratricopeptide (TPR) repeat protein
MQDETKRRCTLYDESFKALSEKCRQFRKQGTEDAQPPSSGFFDLHDDLVDQSELSRSIQSYSERRLSELELVPEDQRDAEYYFNKGFSEIMAFNYENAISAFTRAIALDDTDANYFYLRADAYYELGKYDEALVDINASIALNSNIDNSFQKRAQINYALGNINKVKPDLLAALDSNEPFAAFGVTLYLSQMPNLPAADRKAIEKEIKRCEKQS